VLTGSGRKVVAERVRRNGRPIGAIGRPEATIFNGRWSKEVRIGPVQGGGLVGQPGVGRRREGRAGKKVVVIVDSRHVGTVGIRSGIAGSFSADGIRRWLRGCYTVGGPILCRAVVLRPGILHHAGRRRHVGCQGGNHWGGRHELPVLWPPEQTGGIGADVSGVQNRSRGTGAGLGHIVTGTTSLGKKVCYVFT
jgi:hypothetical protein